MIFKSLDLTPKDVDVRKGIVTGYFSSFGNRDADGDIMRPGAFLRSIQESGPGSRLPRIKHLLDHDRRQPLGKLLVLKEDSKGLYYESKIGSHQLGEDFLKMAESGIITEHSIGFLIPPGKSKRNEQLKANEIFEVDLKEGSSLLAWGANPDTPLVGVKSAQQLIDTIDSIAHALKHGTFSDETFKQLDQRHKALGKVIEEQYLISALKSWAENMTAKMR